MASYRITAAKNRHDRSSPISRFFVQVDQRPHETSNLRWRDGLFVHEDYPAMLSPFFCPRLEQQRNGPAVAGNGGQPFRGSFQQASGIFPAQEVTLLPFHHPMHYQRIVATSEAICQADDVLEERPKHQFEQADDVESKQ